MLQQGDKVREYTLEKYLGKGSYGEVWFAQKKIELSDEGIPVALKFLGYQPQRGKAKEDFIHQVKREVGTWIKASGHKNIVSVQDGFVFRDDTFVIVSDFADGGSLGDWLETHGGKSPSLEKTVELMSEILDGLAYLHSQTPDRIIHRDLKPDNILFKSGVPCITDFGVSRMSQTITRSMAQVAATSAGTPLYMAPESFNNQPAARSMDIWSAGVILYQMLAGGFPYYADNALALALEVISGNPPNPLSADVPPELRAIVAKALAKAVSQRFQTAEEMKSALKNWRNLPLRAPLTDTLIAEDFGKTDILEIAPTRDWQTPETEKAEQERLERERTEQKKAERERIESEAEAKRIERQRFEENLRKQEENLRKQKEDELRRQQEEKSRREAEKLRASKTSRNILLGIGGFIGLISLLMWINQSPPVSVLNAANSANAVSNKTSNVPANAKSANSAVNKPANTVTNSANPKSGDVMKNSIGMEFVKIPAGAFMMGSPPDENNRGNDETQRRVTISKDFYLGKYEVTQGQWKAVMGSNPSSIKGDNLPVENVSWEDAQEFIAKMNGQNDGFKYRLPSEAEWEYACRAGTTGEYYGNVEGIGWYSGNSGSKTNPVGQKQANAWGLYDMSGNVWEWVADWYGEYEKGAVTDPRGASSGSSRVLRGGSWGVDAAGLRSAARLGNSPSNRDYALGFRVVRN